MPYLVAYVVSDVMDDRNFFPRNRKFRSRKSQNLERRKTRKRKFCQRSQRGKLLQASKTAEVSGLSSLPEQSTDLDCDNLEAAAYQRDLQSSAYIL
jgi:hypothetical protein